MLGVEVGRSGPTRVWVTDDYLQGTSTLNVGELLAPPYCCLYSGCRAINNRASSSQSGRVRWAPNVTAKGAARRPEYVSVSHGQRIWGSRPTSCKIAESIAYELLILTRPHTNLLTVWS